MNIAIQLFSASPESFDFFPATYFYLLFFTPRRKNAKISFFKFVDAENSFLHSVTPSFTGKIFPVAVKRRYPKTGKGNILRTARR